MTLQPQYGADNTTIVGYQSSNSIDVKVRKIDDRTAGARRRSPPPAATPPGSTRSTYSIEDDSQLVKDARGRAFDDAKSRAEQYAELSGLDLGKVMSISETGGATPPPPIADAALRRGGRGRAAVAGPADRRLRRDGGVGTGLTPLSDHRRDLHRDPVQHRGSRQRVERQCRR